MRLSNLPAQWGIFVGLALVLLFPSVALRAEERSAAAPEPLPPLAAALGVRFVDGSDSSVILERDGKQYVVDLSTRTIREQEPVAVVASMQPRLPAQASTGGGSGATIFQQQCASCHGNDGKGTGTTPDLTDFRARSGIPTQRIVDTITNGRPGGAMPSFAGKLSQSDIQSVATHVQGLSQSSQRADIYEAADDYVYSLPTGRRLPRGSLFLNFSHRFAYGPAFSGSGLGNTLLGLDGFSVSSFGFRYGVTDKLSISAFRSPSIISRPIEFMAAYNFLDEYDDHPFNAAFRVSIDGQDNFRKNFTTNVELIVSRSIKNKAQFYAVPTFSIENRRLVTKPGALESRPPNMPGINTFSLGAGLAVNIRPTVALVTEVIPTLVHGRELGIHRPAYAFGIQKQVRGHAFTLGFSQGPGITVAQRAGTRATFVGDPSADKPSGLFIGFNLMRRLR